ncbi:MAG: hypothetical protein AABY04_01455, partial [Candidatus Micrarchaeota archaeon]
MKYVGFFIFAMLLAGLIGYSLFEGGGFGLKNSLEKKSIAPIKDPIPIFRQSLAPAINSDGISELAIIKVEAKKGTGKISIDLKNTPVISQETQNSIKNAGNYALQLAGKENNMDLTFS